MMGSILQDLRLAVRTLLKDRGFTVVTILTLAVAIGANTAIFSVVDAVLLRPLAYPDAEEIITMVSIGRTRTRRSLGFLIQAIGTFARKTGASRSSEPSRLHRWRSVATESRRSFRWA